MLRHFFCNIGSWVRIQFTECVMNIGENYHYYTGYQLHQKSSVKLILKGKKNIIMVASEDALTSNMLQVQAMKQH